MFFPLRSDRVTKFRSSCTTANIVDGFTFSNQSPPAMETVLWPRARAQPGDPPPRPQAREHPHGPGSDLLSHFSSSFIAACNLMHSFSYIQPLSPIPPHRSFPPKKLGVGTFSQISPYPDFFSETRVWDRAGRPPWHPHKFLRPEA